MAEGKLEEQKKELVGRLRDLYLEMEGVRDRRANIEETDIDFEEISRPRPDPVKKAREAAHKHYEARRQVAREEEQLRAEITRLQDAIEAVDARLGKSKA